MKDVAGKDLKIGMLSMFNKMKEENYFPEFTKIKNISALYKGSGSKQSLENQRGIIIGLVFNNIIMDMMYNDYYKTVDNEMSDSNLGSRRNKNVRNHTWVIHGIMNEALRTKNGEVDLLIQDFRQCFDSLSVDTVINHLYDSGIKDNKLNLIDKADRSSYIKVNTPVGSTETN